MALRKLTLSLLTLFSLSSFGQELRKPEFVALLSQAPSGYSDPSGSNTLYAWWVSIDLNVNAVVQDTNPWTDRIKGILLRKNGGTATNALLGIYTGTSGAGLSNAPTAQNSNSTICIIFRSVGVANGDNPATCLVGPYDLGDGTQAVTPGGISIDKASTTLYWGTAFVGGSSVSAALENAKTYDVISVQASNTISFFTNGVQSAELTKTPPATGWPWRYVGQDHISAANHFDGYVKEVLIWSNSFSSVQLSNVHYYATNRYSYAP